MLCSDCSKSELYDIDLLEFSMLDILDGWMSNKSGNISSFRGSLTNIDLSWCFISFCCSSALFFFRRWLNIWSFCCLICSSMVLFCIDYVSIWTYNSRMCSILALTIFDSSWISSDWDLTYVSNYWALLVSSFCWQLKLFWFYSIVWACFSVCSLNQAIYFSYSSFSFLTSLAWLWVINSSWASCFEIVFSISWFLRTRARLSTCF